MTDSMLFKSVGYGSFLGPGLAGGYGYGYSGGFGGPVVQRSDGGGGFITILVVVAALFIASQVASNVFGGGGDGNDSGRMAFGYKIETGRQSKYQQIWLNTDTNLI